MLKFWQVLKKAFTEFFADNGVKLSASLSYYTVFSIGPVLIIIISLAGIFFGREAVQGKIYGQINGLVGNAAAMQIQDIIKNIEHSQLSASGAVLGIIFLIIGATGVFTEIQDSINYIWSIKAKPKRGIVHLLMNRIISFSLIISFGFVLLVSLTVNAFVDLLRDRLTALFDHDSVILFQVVNYIMLYAIISTLFAIIFKVLPDAKIRWKDAFIGAGFTSILFLIGKFLIGFYLSNSNVGVTYGAAASIILLLLWVYYTSIILYFGAEFTKVYTIDHGGGIEPDKAAVFIIKKESKELNPKGEV
ncbi:MAG: ribonuclease BN [Azospira oryzae]|jgi:membrane protein|nr:ribonuclease BN [Cytophaga sp.]PZR37539.1 MAG: ribonuclease BN [Azospira oryzae]